MQPADVEILRLLHTATSDDFGRIGLPPMVVYKNLIAKDKTERARRTIHDRLERLQEINLVETCDVDDKYYRITDLGVDFVNDEHDLEALLPPTNSERF
jgi:hypothetical protein